MTNPKAENQLMAYMMGWRAGALARATNAEQMSNKDFVAGHTAGRKAISDAYRLASDKYGAELSPLREKP